MEGGNARRAVIERLQMFKQYNRDVLGLKNPDSDSTKTGDFTKFPHK